MPTYTVYPTGSTSSGAWTGVGATAATDFWQNVDEDTAAPDDTNYVQITSNIGVSLNFTFSMPTLGDAEYVTNISWGIRKSTSAAATGFLAAFRNGTTSMANTSTNLALNTSGVFGTLSSGFTPGPGNDDQAMLNNFNVNVTNGNNTATRRISAIKIIITTAFRSHNRMMI